MLVQNQVGPISATSSVSAGTLAPQRAGNLGDTIVSELHGRYYESTYRRAVFSAANPSLTVTSVGVATTVTGLILTNPIGSTVNLVLNKFGYGFVVAQPTSAAIWGLATGYNSGTAVTQTTPVTPKNNFVGVGASGQGLVASAATVPTAATLQVVVGAALTAAITTVPFINGIYDLEGSIILPPGAYVHTYTTVASAATSATFSFQWEEVPV